MQTYKLFTTERLIVKPITTDDATFIFELMNTPKWHKFIGDRNVNTLSDAKNYIKERMIPQVEEYGYSNYVITRKEDQTKIGTCGLYHREGKESIDIGFAFLPQYEGYGYAFEASSKLIDFGRDEFNINTLSAFTMEENVASRKLIERLGFKLVGTDKLPNSDEELLHYHKFL